MIKNTLLQGHYYIETFGCQMNTADSERMSALMTEAGLNPTQVPENASVIIVNGCSVREKAVHKAVSSLGRFKNLKKGQSAPLIGVGGCVAQLDKEDLFQKAPFVDFVFGTDCIDQLPEILYRASLGEKKILVTEFDPSLSYSTQTKITHTKATAFVNIMKGCDKYCTYCIVPFTRGKEKSRTIDEVLKDLCTLATQGIREVTLLGQNVNSFGKGNSNHAKREPLDLHNIIGKVGPKAGEENFPQLLYAIEEHPGCASIQRIRFTSSHPLDFSDELIECYVQLKKLARHLHLPVQSGSNRILQKMGRHHKIENYIQQMHRLKSLCPEVGLSSDFIVGFPGETEADFQETLNLLETIEFDSIFAFAYSERPGTRASKLPNDVLEEEKKSRLNRLLAKQSEISFKKNQMLLEQTREILVEGLAKNQNLKNNREGHVWTGRTSCNKVVNFYSPSVRNFTNQFIQVKITAAAATALQGEIIV